MGEAKAKIDLNSGIVELEGSEQFVRSYLEEFKALIVGISSSQPTHHEERAAAKSRVAPEKQRKEAVRSKKKTGAKKVGSKRIVPERFDIHGGKDVPALKDFLDEKKPGDANGPIISVIGYYITEVCGADSFSEGQIEYAYKMLNLKRPRNLRQIMINEKNRKDLFEPSEDDPTKWTLTRTGEIFVADTLPMKDEA